MVVSRGILQQKNLMLITTTYLNRQQNKCTGNHDYHKCLSWPVTWSEIPITNCTERHYYKPNAFKKIPWIGNCSLKVMNAAYSVHRQHIMFRDIFYAYSTRFRISYSLKWFKVNIQMPHAPHIAFDGNSVIKAEHIIELLWM